MNLVKDKYSAIDKAVSILDEDTISPQAFNSSFKDVTSQIAEGKKASALIMRPDVFLKDILGIVPRGTTILDNLKNLESSYPETDSADGITLTFRPSGFTCKKKDSYRNSLSDQILTDAETAIKYRGYVQREQAAADRMARLEELKIPQGFDFMKVTSISMEGRLKLMKYKPQTIAQASRISGVSPADISVLLVYFGR